MKVQLVVVQGKPEGKMIPLAGPKFKIGRGEGCHLRPNSDQVSREHAEFNVGPDSVTVHDLGSRNGTDVNGKRLAQGQKYVLKNGDLVKVGSLTFAIAIEGAPAAKAPARKPSLDDAGQEDIDSWLVADEARPTPDRPSGVYGGDTMTIESYKELAKDQPSTKAKTPAPAPSTKAKPPTPAPAPAARAPEPEAEVEPEADMFEQYKPDDDDGIEDLSKAAEPEVAEEEFMDESNPFYVKKKKDEAPAPSAKASEKNSSDAAGDILRKMMERRKARS